MGMLTVFRNLRARTKLFVGFGSLTLCVGLVAGVGYLGMATLNRSLTQLHDDHFEPSLALSETATKLNAQRAHLLAMTQTKDRATQEKEHAAIKEYSRDCEAIFDRLKNAHLSSETAAKLAEVRRTWEEFRDVRDKQLIPAIYDGRI